MSVTGMVQLASLNDYQSHSQKCSMLLQEEREKQKRNGQLKFHFNFYNLSNKCLVSTACKSVSTQRSFYHVFIFMSTLPQEIM